MTSQWLSLIQSAQYPRERELLAGLCGAEEWPGTSGFTFLNGDRVRPIMIIVSMIHLGGDYWTQIFTRLSSPRNQHPKSQGALFPLPPLLVTHAFCHYHWVSPGHHLGSTAPHQTLGRKESVSEGNLSPLGWYFLWDHLVLKRKQKAYTTSGALRGLCGLHLSPAHWLSNEPSAPLIESWCPLVNGSQPCCGPALHGATPDNFEELGTLDFRTEPALRLRGSRSIRDKNRGLGPQATLTTLVPIPDSRTYREVGPDLSLTPLWHPVLTPAGTVLDLALR